MRSDKVWAVVTSTATLVNKAALDVAGVKGVHEGAVAVAQVNSIGERVARSSTYRESRPCEALEHLEDAFAIAFVCVAPRVRRGIAPRMGPSTLAITLSDRVNST